MKRIKDYTLGEAQEICRAQGTCTRCRFSRAYVDRDHCPIGIGHYPGTFDLTDRPRFTPQEVEDAKTLMRLFGYSGDARIGRSSTNGLWVTGETEFSKNRLFHFEDNTFPSVLDGEEYTLDEIIADSKEDNHD